MGLTGIMALLPRQAGHAHARARSRRARSRFRSGSSIHPEDIRRYLEHVAGPWVLKPRQEASAIGIKKILLADELWPILEQLGEKAICLPPGKKFRSRRGLPRGFGRLR